jgi:hypothetical protein
LHSYFAEERSTFKCKTLQLYIAQDLLGGKAYYQAFWGVLIDLIVELLGLIIKPFDNQTES